MTYSPMTMVPPARSSVQRLDSSGVRGSLSSPREVSSFHRHRRRGQCGGGEGRRRAAPRRLQTSGDTADGTLWRSSLSWTLRGLTPQEDSAFVLTDVRRRAVTVLIA